MISRIRILVQVSLRMPRIYSLLVVISYVLSRTRCKLWFINIQRRLIVSIFTKDRSRFLYLKNQNPVQSLLVGKMYLTNLTVFSFIVLIVDWCRGALAAFSGEWEGSERPRSVSGSQKKQLPGMCLHISIHATLDSYLALVFHMCSGLMPPLLKALLHLLRVYPAFLLHKLLVWMAQLSQSSSG